MTSGDYYSQRIGALRRTFGVRKLEAFITTHPASLRYLCGYSGSNGLLMVSADSSWFFSDFRYQESMQTEVQAEKKITGKGSLLQAAVERNLLSGARHIGFEKEHLTVTGLENIRSLLTGKRIVLTAGVIEQLRSVKDESEIATLKKAFDISDRVFQKVLGLIRPGMTELELSAEISYLHKRYGAENDSFDVIAASGVRGSLPHGTATEKRIAKNEFVTLDFGCLVHGYHSDMTRTVCVGRPTAEMKKVYAIVSEAQQRGCDAVKEGVAAKRIDSVSRRYITSFGYGKYFGHSLGHGVGLDIHELPRIAPKSRDVLRSGNVITIEPGVYLPQRFGIRIEDTVVVRKEGCEVLTGSPKELIIL